MKRVPRTRPTLRSQYSSAASSSAPSARSQSDERSVTAATFPTSTKSTTSAIITGTGTPLTWSRFPTWFRFLLAGGGGVVVGLIMVLVAWSWWSFDRISVAKSQKNIPLLQSEVGPSATPTPPPPYRTFLILGYGGGGHAGGRLTDTMIAVFVDEVRKRVTLLSLPRDVWIELPMQDPDPTKNLRGWKLNAAYAIGSDDRSYPNKPAEFSGEGGGGALAQYAVAQITGIPMEHFIAVDFEGFVQSIDVLGGVEVVVGQAFTDPWYPIEGEENNACGKSEEEIAAITATASAEQAQHEFPCRFETLEFLAGSQLLDGTTALKYVRSRHSDVAGNDFSRSRRQREVIVAVRDAVFSLNFVPRAIPFLNTLSGHVEFDFTRDELQQLVGTANDWSTYEVRHLALTDKNYLEPGRSSDRQYVLLPRAGEGNFSEIHAWLESELASESATATDRLKARYRQMPVY